MHININKFLHSSTGKYLISIVLGLGLASLFRESCKGKNCIYFEAPPMEEINGKIFEHDNKCYKFKTSSTSCNAHKKSVEIGGGSK